jgi:hypothetical protein
MRRMISLVIVISLLTGCATANSHWETAAVGAALADVASTGGALRQDGQFHEANPIYGKNPSSSKMLLLNVGVYAGVWALSQRIDPVERQKLWRTVTFLRLLATGWNMSQTGQSFTLRF